LEISHLLNDKSPMTNDSVGRLAGDQLSVGVGQRVAQAAGQGKLTLKQMQEPVAVGVLLAEGGFGAAEGRLQLPFFDPQGVDLLLTGG
jgi:hypothetical protein